MFNTQYMYINIYQEKSTSLSLVHDPISKGIVVSRLEPETIENR